MGRGDNCRYNQLNKNGTFLITDQCVAVIKQWRNWLNAHNFNKTRDISDI